MISTISFTIPSLIAISSSSVVSSPIRPLSMAWLSIDSYNDYFAPISFPACAELGLRVKIGNSSVTYENSNVTYKIALFEKGVATPG